MQVLYAQFTKKWKEMDYGHIERQTGYYYFFHIA